MMRWTIYCHTHIQSGRRYVGLTSRTMIQRWKDHVSTAMRSKGGRWHFPNAIRKYGKDAFFHEVLETCYDLEIANLAEECWIAFYETRNPEKGFNLAKGGKHVPHPIRKNPWNDPEYRVKCTTLARERGADPFWRLNNSKALTGRRLSQIHCQNISKSRSQQTASEERVSQMRSVTQKLWRDPSYSRNKQRKISGEMVCAQHGSLLFDQCYKRIRKNGYAWYMCKQCVSDHNKRRRRVGGGVRIVQPRV